MQDDDNPSPCPALTPAAIVAYLDQCVVGRACELAMYPTGTTAADVRRYSVQRILPHLYRGVILRVDEVANTFTVEVSESDRHEVERWMRNHGVPVLCASLPRRRPR